MPQNVFEGLVVVSGLKIPIVSLNLSSVSRGKRDAHAKLIEPTNLAESVPPKVTSPLTLGKVVVGSKEIPTWFAAMTACAKRLSVTMTGIFEWK